MTTQTLLDFDLAESSSDSDFRIEDHDESDDDFSDGSKARESDQEDDGDSGSSSDDDGKLSDSREGSSSGCSGPNQPSVHNNVQSSSVIDKIKGALAKTTTLASLKEKLPLKPICCVCLGDRSDDTNEVIGCDSCGVSVHEGCYGVSDTASVSSTTSSCSTEPWFCEACRAGVVDPSCELCPNKGGIFKETDVGKWVHLVCALYVPGVAFGEVDQLSSVTLFEMPYNKWGAKTCTLCDNERFSRTGVCIGCDAGMCKTFFHVTCAQAAGFLSEAHSEEADHADPFYAHCKVHSDKTMTKHRKRAFNTIKLVMEHRRLEKLEQKNENPTPGQIRIQRKLAKYQTKYKNNKTLKIEPWVPTQKIPRLLTSSATACSRLLKKAVVMEIDIPSLERQEIQVASLVDIRKKWHIAPAFSVEFISYYLDRISRVKELKNSLEQMVENNTSLLSEQQRLRDQYDTTIKSNSELKAKHESLQSTIREFHKHIETLCPNKTMPPLENIGRPTVTPNQVVAPPARPMSVPTAAALKMGVGFPLAHLPGTKDDTGRVLSTQSQNKTALVHECGICKGCNDQHLLAKCDTCHSYYHLGCLNPPLTRHPKKSKLYGWQCSECDKSDDSDAMTGLPKGPRKSRTRFSKDGTIVPAGLNISATSLDNNLSPKPTSPSKRKSSDFTARAPKKSLTESTTGKSQRVSRKSSEPMKRSTPIEDVNVAKKARIKPADCSPITIQNPMIVLEDAPNPSASKKQGLASSIVSEEVQKKGTEDTHTSSSELIANKTSSEQKIEQIATDESTNIVATSSANIIKDTHSKSRKKRKEKHKNKYSSDNEKSPSKEHKRKRKKKSHDKENPNENGPAIPKIKITFKTLPLPGEQAPEPHFVYVSADMVRPNDISRPTSVETVEDSPTIEDSPVQPELPVQTSVVKPTITKGLNKTPTTPVNTSRTKSPSARRLNFGRQSSKRMSGAPDRPTPTNSQQIPIESTCDVCKKTGTPQNLVFCDECHKNYHFTCLDPPLKKTPKRRGYSWHCADCDPTDVETT